MFSVFSFKSQTDPTWWEMCRDSKYIKTVGFKNHIPAFGQHVVLLKVSLCGEGAELTCW